MLRAHRIEGTVQRGWARVLALAVLFFGVFMICLGTYVIPDARSLLMVAGYLYFYGLGALCIAAAMAVIEANGEEHLGITHIG